MSITTVEFCLDVVYNVKYSLGSEGDLQLDFSAAVTAPTPVNLVNHVYINLAGHKAGADGEIFCPYCILSAPAYKDALQIFKKSQKNLASILPTPKLLKC